MKILEQKTDKIFKLNNELNCFIQEDHLLNQLFQKFRLKKETGNTIYDFMFDETINKDKKLIDIFLEKNPQITQEEKDILNCLKNNINSVFEVKNIKKDGFELYNLVNEKTYNAKCLIKMVNYRGVFKGNFLICRLIPLDGEFFLFSIDNVIKNSDKISAYQLAVSRQLEDTTLLYRDNPDKLRELERSVEFLAQKYDEFFNNQEILTRNTQINPLLDTFNDYVDNKTSKADFQEFIEQPENYAYFDLNKNSSTVYDVAVIFVPESGLLTLPFLGTFYKIFEVEDYTSIKDFKNCVEHFLKNDKIPPFVLEKTYERFGEKFVQRIREILNIKKDIKFEDLIHKYKQNFLREKHFTSPTVLYSSAAFDELMKLTKKRSKIEQQGNKNIGRNDPCICGSGKKYKKCCM